VRGNFDVHGQTDEDRIAGVAAQALDQLQDYIDEATHDPWPGERAQPRAYAHVRDRTLHLWFGRTRTNFGMELASAHRSHAHATHIPKLTTQKGT
jgi:hypothetical protein